MDVRIILSSLNKTDIMGFRNEKKATFEKFELEEPADNMEDVFEAALGGLEEKGLSGSNEEPSVTIVLSNHLQGDNGNRLTTAIIYVGATPEQVTNDLFLMQQK